ncbi:MAG: hypothetical protein EBS11_25780 [Janthinobacterium sp.]|nr:hypothetical protein [Janthinobacterium sp.]
MLEVELKELRALAAAATIGEAFAAAAQARSKILEVRREIEHIHEESIIAAAPDEVAKLDLMIRRATADGSHVAAKDLLRARGEAVARRNAAKAEEEAKNRRDPAVMRAKIIEILRSMPDRAVDELLAEVRARREVSTN